MNKPHPVSGCGFLCFIEKKAVHKLYGKGRGGMRKTSKSKKKKTVIIFLIAVPLLTLLLSLLTAKLILDGKLSEEQLNMGAIVITGLVAFMASLYAAIRSPQKKLFWGMGAAGAYALALMLGNLLFFGVGYGRVFPQLLVILGSGLLGSLCGAVKRKKYA